MEGLLPNQDLLNSVLDLGYRYQLPLRLPVEDSTLVLENGLLPAILKYWWEPTSIDRGGQQALLAMGIAWHFSSIISTYSLITFKVS